MEDETFPRISPINAEEASKLFHIFQNSSNEYETLLEMIRPVLQQLDGKPPVKLMSIGAGDGSLEDMLIKQLGLRVEYFHGVEPDGGRREKLKKIEKTWQLTTESFIDDRFFGENFESDTKFDLILMSHVLYSIPKPTEAILRARNMLKKEGKLVIFHNASQGLPVMARKVKVLFNEAIPVVSNSERVIEDFKGDLQRLGEEYRYSEANFHIDVTDFITRQGGDNEKEVVARNHVISFFMQTRFEKLPADLQSEIYQFVRNGCRVQCEADNKKKYLYPCPMGMLVLEGNEQL